MRTGGRRAPTATLSSASRSSGSAGTWISGGAVAQLVELLDRRLEHLAVARRRRSPRRCRARRARRPGRCAPGRPGRRRRPARASGRTRRDGRARRSPSSAGDRAASAPCASRRAAAPPPRTARRRPRRASAPRSVFDQLVVLAFEEQPRQLDRAAVLLRRADRVDARRDAALDVVFEARPAALAGDHLVARPDAEQPVRQRHRLAREVRRQERAGVEAAVALDARARPARAETPRWSSAAGTGSSCRRAAGCCIWACAA